MAKRARLSTIDVLDDAIKAEIGRLRRTHTIDQILAHLQNMEVEVSRSALGRHVQKLGEISERMNRSREMATALVSKFGEEPDNRLARLNLELMHSVVMEVMTATTIDPETGEVSPIKLDPAQAMFLAKALQSLSSAQKTDADRMLKVQEQLKKEAATAVEKVGKAKGLTAETVADIRAAVLGIGK